MSELLMAALQAKAAKDDSDASHRKWELRKAIQKRLGRRFAKRIKWESSDPAEPICSIDGVLFMGTYKDCYGGPEIFLQASFGGDSWCPVTNMAGLGQVLLDRHERGTLDESTL